MTRHVLDQLPLWVEGDLDEPELGAVEGHLARCPACRVAADRMKTSQAWLREAMESPFELADQASLHRDVMELVRAETRVTPTRHLTARPVFLAACAATLLVATLVWRQDRGDGVQVPLPFLPPAPAPAEGLSHQGRQPRDAGHVVPRAAPPRTLTPPGLASGASPNGGPTRIEFQTTDPTIRIIWLAQAKPLPDSNPTTQEEP